jgi:hypothetical protein
MIAVAALSALLLSGPAATDAWSQVVTSHAARRTVLAKLGIEASRFVSSFDQGGYPLQLTSSPAEPGTASETAAPTTVVEVLEYPGPVRGLHYQVALQAGKALYALAPPLDSEKEVSAITRGYGPSQPREMAVIRSDVIKTWKVLTYPAKKRLFVLGEDGKTVLARMILP